jgi:hypothetical protein
LSSTGATDKTVALTGTVSNTPSAPSLTSVSRCSTGTVSFTQAVRLNAPAPYKLYDAAVNGNVVGSSLTTPSISQTTDFWATITTGACESARTKVTATVKQPSATILNETACDKYFFNGVDRTISGTYTQTLTNKVGCDSVVTLNLVINVSPSAPNLTSTPICGTGSVTFSTVAPTRLNTLVSPNKLYNAETAGSVVGTGYTTPSISQTTDFWATITTGACESARTKVTATVKQPSASSMSQTACDSYVFGSKTLTQSGVYKDTIPNAIGCDSVRTLNLTINNTPTMPTLISNQICKSGTVTFNEVAPGRLAVPAPYKLYDASVNGNVVGSGLTTPTISQTTDFYVTITSDGCESARKKVSAIVNPLPTVSITVTPNDTINEGESITLAGKGAASYTWNNDITDNVAFNPTQSGLYKVVGKDDNNCTNADSINIVVNKLTAIESSNSTNFSIYPNPATDNVTITLTESVSGTISIVDLKGNVVATKSISGNTSNISTADLASGVYVVKISSDKGVAVKQLVIQ